MRYSKKMLVLSTVVFPAMLIIFSTSCGGGSSSSSSNSMSQAQAQAVSQQVFTTLGQALASAFSSDAAAPSTERPTLAAAFSQLQPNNDSSGCSGGRRYRRHSQQLRRRLHQRQPHDRSQ